MANKPLALSIIILAYNEENQLPDCLDAIAAQTVKPDEVIVVDNNSTDNTVRVARSYPFVRVIAESKQGMIPARNAGFAAAAGDILSRIDADAKLAPDWVERLHYDFNDKSVQAVGGVARAQLLPVIKRYQSTIWSKMYLWWMEWRFNLPVLWGANMAIRRSAWSAIQVETSPHDWQVHEDQDISVLLAKHHLKVLIDSGLVVATDSQDKNEFIKYYSYVWRMNRTILYHRRLGNFDNVVPVYSLLQRALLFLIYAPLKSLYLFGMIFTSLAMYVTALTKRQLALLRTQPDTDY